MEAKDLSFSYGQSDFIKNLNITLEKGRITTILGPNGSGKSTLLNLFVKQFHPDRGEIFIDQLPLAQLRQREVARRISVVHQHNTSPGDLTVEALVSYGRIPHQSFWKNKSADDQEQIDWAMRATNIYHMKDRCVEELSGGERQRTWIAMALAQKTDLLFLDEPTTYLDISYQMEVLDLVRDLNRRYRITIVMVLHDINQAIQYSDRLLILKSGKIRYEGDAKNGITEKLLKEIYGIDAVIRYCPVNHCNYMIPIQKRERE